MNEGLDALKELIEMGYLEVEKGWQEDIVAIDDINIIEKQLIDYKRLLEIINKYIKIDNNYNEISSGSTKAFKICIPNYISVEEDDEYIDECYPNTDYDFINDLLKEVFKNE